VPENNNYHYTLQGHLGLRRVKPTRLLWSYSPREISQIKLSC